MSGTVVSILVADGAGAAMRSLPEARLVAGRGIVGDRYHDGTGEFSPEVPDPDHELTLVESEQLERFRAETGLALDASDLRRNVVTRGVSLDALVGREFSVGPVAIRGIRLCEPCRYLAGRTHSEVVPRFVHRAGLRAAILRGGIVRPGDPIQIGPGSSAAPGAK